VTFFSIQDPILLVLLAPATWLTFSQSRSTFFAPIQLYVSFGLYSLMGLFCGLIYLPLATFDLCCYLLQRRYYFCPEKSKESYLRQSTDRWTNYLGWGMSLCSLAFLQIPLIHSKEPISDVTLRHTVYIRDRKLPVLVVSVNKWVISPHPFFICLRYLVSSL
jgi:hypothetical protein